MPLVGGGGSPNVAGGNPAGVGSSLNYIGAHAYGTSGVISDSSSGSAASTMFDFTTGSNYIVGYLNFSNDEAATDVIYLEMLFDGQVVIHNVVASTHFSEPQRFDILLPPYTRVQVKWGASTNQNATAFITGRVYA